MSGSPEAAIIHFLRFLPLDTEDLRNQLGSLENTSANVIAMPPFPRVTTSLTSGGSFTSNCGSISACTDVVQNRPKATTQSKRQKGQQKPAHSLFCVMTLTPVLKHQTQFLHMPSLTARNAHVACPHVQSRVQQTHRCLLALPLHVPGTDTLDPEKKNVKACFLKY